jgi:hypothetical protein
LKTVFVAFLLCIAALAAAQTRIGISGEVAWDKMEISALVSLDLASANIKLPAGRTQGEALIAAEYLRLIRPGILDLRVDSSSTLADLVGRGDFTLLETDTLAMGAKTVPPALSPDFRSLAASYSLNMAGISAALIRHERAAESPRILNPVAAPAYTGIIIIANESLPLYGRQIAALPTPCLFPKIWDTDMNLIFERNMLEAKADGVPNTMIRYAPARGIFTAAPSGLSPEISALVGDKPLRIFARGVFGVNPTDPIIDREDALQIVSTEENRRLLRQGKVIIILDESVLKNGLAGGN